MPCQENQIYSGDFKEGIILSQDIKKDDALFKFSKCKFSRKLLLMLIFFITVQRKAMLNHARIDLGNEFNVEYSHHYGVKKFSETGVFNRMHKQRVL